MKLSHRGRKRGQSLVIIALSATVLFGIIALGLDAGRLYFQRRDVQNAADSGALAGAQELIPTAPNLLGGDPAKARCQAVRYALLTFNDAPVHDCSQPNLNGFWSSGTTITETAQNDTAPKVTATAPYRPNEIKVDVVYTVPTTFASVIGFRSSDVAASAVAHDGFFNKVYTIFGFDSTGSGNSVNYDQNGNAQIDDGKGGGDCQTADPTLGKMVSNAKFHAPNPNGGVLNLNGDFHYAQASDTHALIVYWQNPVSPGLSPVDPAPGYAPPDPPSGTISWGKWKNVGGVQYWLFTPGTYNGTINIPVPGGSASDRYVFQNGIYYFYNGGLNITGGYVSNTSTGQPMYNGQGWGTSDMGTGSDTITNGVEFVFGGNQASPGNATFSATGNPHVFFVAPNAVPSPATNRIAFFITQYDTTSGPNGQVWTEQVDGTQGGEFQVWGTLFNADLNGSHGTVVVVQAVSSTGVAGKPYNTNHYAVTGEVVSPQVDIDGGGLTSNGGYTASTCPAGSGNGSGYRQNGAGLLVQFNANFAPQFYGFSYLIK